MRFADEFARVADKLRTRGFTVHEQAGWATRGRRGEDLIAVDTITVHHTATPGADDYRSLNLVTNGRSDLAGPLCNWGVGRHGGIYLIAAGSANHTGKTWTLQQSNKYAVGIECENDGVGEPWSGELWDALTALVQELRREFAIPSGLVYGHREICVPAGRKVDPTPDIMRALRNRSDPPTPTKLATVTTTPVYRLETPGEAMYAVNLPATENAARRLDIVRVPTVGSALSLGKGDCYISFSPARDAKIHRLVLTGPGYFEERIKVDTDLKAGQPIVIKLPAKVVQVEVEYTSPLSPIGVLVEPLPA